jgi:hypothetical protein
MALQGKISYFFRNGLREVDSSSPNPEIPVLKKDHAIVLMP